jgi:hypothetical protein
MSHIDMRPSMAAGTGAIAHGVTRHGMILPMEPGGLRAADADRERVAERLRIALDEGRLNLYEYDERLREAYAARTYGELDQLLADLPGPTEASRAQVALPGQGTVDRPGPDGRYPDATRRWLAEVWSSWVGAVSICTVIWGFSSLFSGDLRYFWPGWVAGPWGVVLLAATFRGLSSDEPQRWAAKRARRQAERELRRRARGADEGDE